LIFLKKNEKNVCLKIAGDGELSKAKLIAKKYNVQENILFMGKVSHDNVLIDMNQSDFVIVPSRHNYPEGLPMTIMESLMVHTPVIASDHPMFVGRVGKKGAVRFFREADPKDIAYTILCSCEDYNEYKKMSINCPKEWHDLTLEAKWADIINSWIDNSNSPELKKYTLAELYPTVA